MRGKTCFQLEESGELQGVGGSDIEIFRYKKCKTGGNVLEEVSSLSIITVFIIFHGMCSNRAPSLLISRQYVLSGTNRSAQKKTAFQQRILVCLQNKPNKCDFGSNLKDQSKDRWV